MVDYVERFSKKLKKHKLIAAVILACIVLVAVAEVIGALEKLNQFFFPPKSKLTDALLKEQTLELARDIAEFVHDRRLNEPQINFNDWENSTTKLLQYDQESITLYYARFGPRVAVIREEFLLRGITDQEFELYYATPTNYIGLEFLCLRLAAMASKL